MCSVVVCHYCISVLCMLSDTSEADISLAAVCVLANMHVVSNAAAADKCSQYFSIATLLLSRG